MDLQEIADALHKQGEAWEEFKRTNDERLSQIEEKGFADTTTTEKLDAIVTDMGELKDTVEEIQARSKVPLREQMQEKPVEVQEHIKAFENFIRNPKSPAAIAELEEKATAVHQKEVTITGTGGGNAIPTEISSRIVNKVLELSPIRQIANVQMSSNENTKFIVGDDDDSSGWVGAGDARNETNTPSVQAVSLTYGTCYGYPKIQEEALNDIEFDVLSWLEDRLARRLAKAEGAAFVSGNGTDKPTGFLNGTPVATDDDSRAFGVLQFFATGVADAFPNDMAHATPGNPGVPLFDLVYGLRAAYRGNARFVMNRNTLSTLMQFRNADGDYLFRPAATAGVPATLMGYPITEAEDMQDIAANAFPVAFGDFNEGYQIGDIVGTMRLTMDDNITEPGFVKFYGRRRTGGNVLNDDAIKLIKVAA